MKRPRTVGRLLMTPPGDDPGASGRPGSSGRRVAPRVRGPARGLLAARSRQTATRGISTCGGESSVNAPSFPAVSPTQQQHRRQASSPLSSPRVGLEQLTDLVGVGGAEVGKQVQGHHRGRCSYTAGILGKVHCQGDCEPSAPGDVPNLTRCQQGAAAYGAAARPPLPRQLGSRAGS
jgi:hypothetical protein